MSKLYNLLCDLEGLIDYAKDSNVNKKWIIKNLNEIIKEYV